MPTSGRRADSEMGNSHLHQRLLALETSQFRQGFQLAVAQESGVYGATNPVLVTG